MIVKDKNFELYIDRATIANRIDELACQISSDYAGKDLLALIVLKGGMFFGVELLTKLSIPCDIETIRLSSYGSQMTSSGVVKTIMGLQGEVANRNVLIIEDIVDTGKTIKTLHELLTEKGVASIAVAALTLKHEVYNGTITLPYIGFRIPNKFVIGFGLDYDQHGRTLPDIYQLAE